LLELRLTWIPGKTETVLRASYTSERQLAVPEGIRINLHYRLMAPVKKRSRCQPTPTLIAHFHALRCPADMTSPLKLGQSDEIDNVNAPQTCMVLGILWDETFKKA